MWISKHELDDLVRERREALEWYWQADAERVSLRIDLENAERKIRELQEKPERVSA
jgi:hypothetical protein